MTFRKLFTIIMCITLIITPNFMVMAEEAEASAPLYLACLGVCYAVAWWKGWDDKYCIAACAATLAAPGAADSGVQIPGVPGE